MSKVPYPQTGAVRIYPNTTVMKSGDHRRIRLIESNAKCRHLKSDLKRNFAAGFYLSEAPSPPRFLSWGGVAIL
jgi:hypothetical protein